MIEDLLTLIICLVLLAIIYAFQDWYHDIRDYKERRLKDGKEVKTK